MFFRTLYSKLACVLFLFVAFSGALFLYLVRISAQNYHQEITQKLNLRLAGNIAKESLLVKDNEINRLALENIFHMLMVINPNIEVYLLDQRGKILAYSAAKDKIKRDVVDLDPIQTFLSTQGQALEFPFYGDDPRHPHRKKIFSVAPVSANGLNEGFLYVILGGKAFDSVVEMIKGSYAIRTSVIGLVTSLSIALIAGLLTFGLFTKRLKTLSEVILHYTKGQFKRDLNSRYRFGKMLSDEIDQLGRYFNLMADHID